MECQISCPYARWQEEGSEERLCGLSYFLGYSQRPHLALCLQFAVQHLVTWSYRAVRKAGKWGQLCRLLPQIK